MLYTDSRRANSANDWPWRGPQCIGTMDDASALGGLHFPAPDICVRGAPESAFSEEVIQIRRDGPGTWPCNWALSNSDRLNSPHHRDGRRRISFARCCHQTEVIAGRAVSLEARYSNR